MTEITFKQRLAELLSGNNDPLEDIQVETMRLARSGGVNIEQYEDTDYGLVKTILAVALHNVAESHTPYPFKEYLRVFKNLKKF